MLSFWVNSRKSTLVQQVLAVILLIVQPFIFFRSVIFSRTASIPFDMSGYHYPQIAFLARCVRDHVMPYWDPYSRTGAPMWSDITCQLFYPPTWIAIFLGNMSNGQKLLFWI